MTEKTAIAAGTNIGLNITITAVATTTAITVPVKVNPDHTNRAAPIVPAVINFTALRPEDGSYLDMGLD
uniref:Uncharacterized protein n=1 Tax=Salix viminalis TaxID=40686 RepID=A0A6N2L1X4_SALVM